MYLLDHRAGNAIYQKQSSEFLLTFILYVLYIVAFRLVFVNMFCRISGTKRNLYENSKKVFRGEVPFCQFGKTSADFIKRY